MAKLQVKYEQLNRALVTFLDAIELLKEGHDKKASARILLAYERSLVQCFEYCIEGSWKYFKDYLESQLINQNDIIFPRQVIRRACLANLISVEETTIFLEMLELRNLTSHIYREELAGIVCLNAQRYYETMKKCTDRMQPSES